MRVVSIYDFRNNLSEYLADLAVSDVPIILRRFGKPLAMVLPYKSADVSVSGYFGFLKNKTTGAAFVASVRRNSREAAKTMRQRNP